MVVLPRPIEFLDIANDYENNLYGPDFYTALPLIDHWLKSPLFYWSICANRKEISNTNEIEGLLSILVTSNSDFAALLSNNIREYELRPWNFSSNERPCLYFCSYSIYRPGAGRLQFAEARKYFDALFETWNVFPDEAFSIAANAEGERHLIRSGFIDSESRYLSRYKLLRTNCSECSNGFWRHLLQCNGTK